MVVKPTKDTMGNSLTTQTLAKVYLEQKYAKAIKHIDIKFEISRKSGFFMTKLKV